MSKLVGLGGLEPPTSRLSSARSNQLSYKPSGINRKTFPGILFVERFNFIKQSVLQSPRWTFCVDRQKAWDHHLKKEKRRRLACLCIEHT